jgi:hypothetical protein
LLISNRRSVTTDVHALTLSFNRLMMPHASPVEGQHHRRTNVAMNATAIFFNNIYFFLITNSLLDRCNVPVCIDYRVKHLASLLLFFNCNIYIYIYIYIFFIIFNVVSIYPSAGSNSEDMITDLNSFFHSEPKFT